MAEHFDMHIGDPGILCQSGCPNAETVCGVAFAIYAGIL